MTTRFLFFAVALGCVSIWVVWILSCNRNLDKTPMEMPEDEQDAIVSIDFSRTFPHKYWISNWSSDESYPQGFRYKLMSIRMEPENKVQFVILLQEKNGDKHEFSRTTYSSLDFFERASLSMVNGLESEFQIDFELQDFSKIRTEHEFAELAAQFGWLDAGD